ncbi:MAG: ATP-binding protein [Candidatus Cryptobacteroides sp.]
MDVNSYIHTLCKKGEGTEIEFKSAKGGFPGSFWETYSAFANTDGGIIVLGISEKNGKFYPDGLSEEQIAKLKKLLWDGLNNKNTVSTCIISESDVLQANVENGFALVVKVPRAEYTQRPVYLTLNPFGGHMFRRRHEGDYKVGDDVVRRIMGESQIADHPLDNYVFPSFILGEEIDQDTVSQYRRLFDAKNQEHPWSELDDLSFLKKIGAYGKDSDSGKEGFTLAGVLMFGTQKGLDDAIPYYYVDYREKMSDDPEIRWTDRVYIDGYWEPNLFQFYNRVYLKIRQALPVPFKLDGIVRVDYTPAHKALREAIINCLVHARYGMMNNIVIERYPDKLVFVNPGTMLISVEQFFAGGTSICRNFGLQKMFSFIGYVERAGSGADTITKGWKENNWPKPQIREIYDPDRVEMVLSLRGLEGDLRKDGTTQKTTTETTTETTIETFKKTSELILDTIKKNPSLTNKELAAICGITTDGVYYQLKQLKASGKIRRVGPNKGGHWEVIK